MLYYINKKNKIKGRIGQYFFEDKSIIISMLALCHTLNNKNVDIISPSKYIAEKNLERYKKLYDLFGIKSNILLSNYDDFTQIIYGTLEEFQINILLEIFNLNNNFRDINLFQIRKKDIILFDEINDLVNDNAFNTSYAYSNNFIDNYIWAYKPIYNYIKKFNQENLAINFLLFDSESIRVSLKEINNGQYKEIVDSISNELINQWIISAFLAMTKHKDQDYIKELKNGQYKISLIDKATGNIDQNLKYAKYVQPFIEIKETIIPDNLYYILGSLSKLVYINYYYKNIFCIGGIIDDNKIFNLYNLDSFDCIDNYKRPNILEIMCPDKNNKFQMILNNIKENNYNNCNILVLFLNYFEANEFDVYLNNNNIKHQFIYGAMNEEINKIISKFENEHCILLSTYDCLKGIHFNICNYEINKYHLIIAFKTEYSEKVYNSLMKGISIINNDKKIEISGILINKQNFEERLLNYQLANNIQYQIQSFKKIEEISLYQNLLIKILNSNECKNIINSYFINISEYSFIADSVNFFRYKWCEYYDKRKNEFINGIINIYEFLNSIYLDNLLFYMNDFEKSIQNEFLNLMLITNLLSQLNNQLSSEFYKNKLKLKNIEINNNIINKNNNNINISSKKIINSKYNDNNEIN